MKGKDREKEKVGDRPVKLHEKKERELELELGSRARARGKQSKGDIFVGRTTCI